MYPNINQFISNSFLTKINYLKFNYIIINYQRHQSKHTKMNIRKKTQDTKLTKKKLNLMFNICNLRD